MQRHDQSPVHSDSNSPISIGPDRKITMTGRTQVALIGAAVAAALSWWSIKSDVTSHGKSLDLITARLANIEQEAKTNSTAIGLKLSSIDAAAAEARLEQKLLAKSVDYLVNDRRGPKPATSTLPGP